MAIDLVSMGAAAGATSGLKSAGETAVDTWKEIRKQDQMFYLGMQQLVLGLKKLDEDQRQATMIHKRFYRGLDHADLAQVRDIKARKQLEQMRSDLRLEEQDRNNAFAMELAEKQHEFKTDEIEQQGGISEDIARIQQAAAHRMETRLSKKLRLEQADEINRMAHGAVASQLMLSGGPDSGTFMNDTQIEQFALDNGYASGMAYKQSLHERFSNSMMQQLGKDAPVPDFKAFNSFIGALQGGDVRGLMEWQQGVSRASEEAAQVTPNAVARDISLVANGYSDDLPMKYNLVNSELSFQESGKGLALENWMRNVIASHADTNDPEVQRQWERAAYDTFREVADVDIKSLDKAERAALDMVFAQESQATSGRTVSLGLSGFDEPNQRRIFKRANEFMTNGSNVNPLSPTSSNLPEGTTTGQLRVFGDVVGSVYANSFKFQADFEEALNAGNGNAAVRAAVNAKKALADIEDPKNRKIRGINDAQFQAAQDHMNQLVNNMIIGLANAKVAAPEGVGISDLEEAGISDKEVPAHIVEAAKGAASTSPFGDKQEELDSLPEAGRTEENIRFILSGRPEREILAAIKEYAK